MKTKMIEIWTNNRVGKNTQTNLQCLLKGLCRQKEGGGVIIKWMGALQLTTKILNKGVTNHKSSPTPLLIGLFCIGVVVYYGVVIEGGGGYLPTNHPCHVIQQCFCHFCGEILSINYWAYRNPLLHTL